MTTSIIHYNTVRSKTIVCALLTGEYTDADKKAAFNMIVSFSTGKPSGD